MAGEFQPEDRQRFEAAIAAFDEANNEDPTFDEAEGSRHPRELLYARRLSDWVLRLCPDATEELRLAARCQHICRWKVPRETFPMTRAGYLRWREELKKFHARKAGEILRSIGYPDRVIARVQSLNLKKDFPHDPEARVLEDALCLVFLEHQFGPLAEKASEDKMINALQKSWKKMTPQARALAHQLQYNPRQQALLAKALSETEP